MAATRFRPTSSPDSARGHVCVVDDFDEERSLLRDIFVGRHADLDSSDVQARREGVALFLDCLATDAPGRYLGWRTPARGLGAFKSGAVDGSPRARAQARWAAAAGPGPNWIQIGLAQLWVSAGPALQIRTVATA